MSDRLYISPETRDFETFVNGTLISKRTQLYDGDRLVIGGSHYFRVSNPKCERRRNSQNPVDFQLAHQEIMAQQEKKLREELELEKRAALQQIQASHRANEKQYEERLQNLEIEKFQIKCSKELLENEVKLYKEQSTETPSPYRSGYKSTLLEDIQKMMARPTKESLHQNQMKVREATQRCRIDFGLSFIEFKQTQKADSFGIFQAVVNIIDRKNGKIAEWPPARLDVWLDLVREPDFDQKNVFKCVDTEWFDFDENDLEESFLNDSMNSSKISLNLSAMKEKILGKTPDKSFNSPSSLVKSALKNSSSKNYIQNDPFSKRKALQFDENVDTPPVDQRKILAESNSKEKPPKPKRVQCAKDQIKDLQVGAHRLKKLLHKGVSEDQKKSVTNSIAEIEHHLSLIRDILDKKEQIPEIAKTPKSVRFLLD